jgi:S1-C subfamily serine protease
MKLKIYLKYYLPEIVISIVFLLFFGCASPSVDVETVESGKIYIKSKKSFFDGLINPLDRLRASVVAIFAGDNHGSGFVISKDGYILTAAHVVGDEKSVKVRFTNGQEVFSKVLRKSMKEDIALLKIKLYKTNPMPLNTNPPKIGSEVWLIANTLTTGTKYNIKITPGTLESYRKEKEIEYIKSYVNVLPGADGGPLVDNDFNAIGVCTNIGFLSESKQFSGLYFLPIADALHSLDIEFK